MDKLEKQLCPICKKKTLTLIEDQTEVPFFGKIFIFSMACSNCKYHKADVESAEDKEPCKYSFEVNSEDDMKIRVVKSSKATIKIPHIITIESGPASNGYVTNIEGIFKRVKNIIESTKEDAEDPDDKKKAKRLLKKISKIMLGKEKAKIIIEDPSGNSAIISDKAKKTKL